MTSAAGEPRVDTASRVIEAAPHALYWTWMDPQALMAWLPPKGLRGRLEAFDFREGGQYRMSLTYEGADHAAPGKTSEHTDVTRGRFARLEPDERIVQLVEFESEDPAFAGTMTMTWEFREASEGTKVTIRCENVPAGIRPEDHAVGLRESLENLAAFAEGGENAGRHWAPSDGAR